MSSPSIPFEIAIMILKFALATPVSTPPNMVDRQLRISTLLISREIREAFMEDMYATVILWSMRDIRKFAAALATSPHLGPLVHNIWVGTNKIKLVQHEGQEEPVKNGCEDVVHCLRRILATTSNLRRLYIAVDVHEYYHKSQCPIPQSVQHLALPSNWLASTPMGVMPDGHEAYQLPSNLESLRTRGVPLGRDIIPIANASFQPPQLVSETYDPDEDFSEFGTWLGPILNPFAKWAPSIKIAASPSVFADAQQALAYYGRSYGSMSDMGRASVICQPMDDEGQLEAWLSEGLPCAVGPF